MPLALASLVVAALGLLSRTPAKAAAALSPQAAAQVASALKAQDQGDQGGASYSPYDLNGAYLLGGSPGTQPQTQQGGSYSATLSRSLDASSPNLSSTSYGAPSGSPYAGGGPTGGAAGGFVQPFNPSQLLLNAQALQASVASNPLSFGGTHAVA